MRIAKADNEDFDGLNEFMQAAESVLEREKFSFLSPEENFENWDEDEPDRIWIEKCKGKISREEGIDVEDVDKRILMYEVLKYKFEKTSCGWRRVYYAATALIDSACDPTESHLAFHPGLELFHVSPEQ